MHPILANGGTFSDKVALFFLAFCISYLVLSSLCGLFSGFDLQAAIIDSAAAAIGVDARAVIASVGCVAPALPSTPLPNLPGSFSPPTSTNLQPPTQAEVAAPSFLYIKSGPYEWENLGRATKRELPKFRDLTEGQIAGVYKYLDTRQQQRALRQKEREEATAAALREISADRAKENVPAPPAPVPRSSFLRTDPDYDAAQAKFAAVFGAGAVTSISAPQSKVALPGHLHADLAGIYVQESEPVAIPRIFEAPPPPPPAPEPTYGYIPKPHGIEELTYDLGRQSLDDGAASGYITTSTLFRPAENAQWLTVQSVTQPGLAAPVLVQPVPSAAPAPSVVDKGKAPIRPGDEPTYSSLDGSVPFAAPGLASQLPIPAFTLAGPTAAAAPSSSGSLFGDLAARSALPKGKTNPLLAMSPVDAQMKVDQIMEKLHNHMEIIRRRTNESGARSAWQSATSTAAQKQPLFTYKSQLNFICDWAVGPNGRVVDAQKMPRSEWVNAGLGQQQLTGLVALLMTGNSHVDLPMLAEFQKATERARNLFVKLYNGLT